MIKGKTTILTMEQREQYRADFKAFGHDEAIRILRMRIVSKLGHAWFQANRGKIAAEVAEIESRCTPAREKEGLVESRN